MKELEENFKVNGGMFEEYRIGELFDIHPTLAYKLTNPQIFTDRGKYPVVTNSSINNGITGYSDLEPTENGNMITYSDTTTSDGIFYQSDNFVGYPHVQGLYPLSNNEQWTEKTLLYFVSLFKKSAGGRFDYANKFTRVIASQMNVTLPTQNNEIAFSYMESVIRELEEERIRELTAYLKASRLENTELTEEEKLAVQKLRSGKVQWKEFNVGDFFTGETGDVDIQNKDIDGLGEYFINSGAQNLGIKGKTSRKAKIFPANTITVDFWGFANYRDYPYKLATHNHVFSFSGDVLTNKERGLFICTLMSYFQKIFSYNNMGTIPTIKRMPIYLPTNSMDEIDWDFMETLITAESKLAVCGVVEWKDRVIVKTKEVVDGGDVVIKRRLKGV